MSFCALRRGEGKRIATSWSVSSPVPESCDLSQECVFLGYGSFAEQDEKGAGWVLIAKGLHHQLV